ncbi:MAG: type II secretion system protein [Armatimonadetes bacterium]|nr:MAG: type II secretion system protein [Armatimonadota bacterium]
MKKQLPVVGVFKGFTLVELLVAITIVAVLSVVGAAIFGGVQQRARDTRRTQDLDAIAAALESKRETGTVYYTALAATDFASSIVPTDPQSATQVYCLWAHTDVPPVAPPQLTAASQVSSWTTCALEASTGPDVDATMIVAAGAPEDATKVTSWTVCARREGDNTKVECRNSKL